MFLPGSFPESLERLVTLLCAVAHHAGRVDQRLLRREHRIFGVSLVLQSEDPNPIPVPIGDRPGAMGARRSGIAGVAERRLRRDQSGLRVIANSFRVSKFTPGGIELSAS